LSTSSIGPSQFLLYIWALPKKKSIEMLPVADFFSILYIQKFNFREKTWGKVQCCWEHLVEHNWELKEHVKNFIENMENFGNMLRTMSRSCSIFYISLHNSLGEGHFQSCIFVSIFARFWLAWCSYLVTKVLGILDMTSCCNITDI
jgi:hypothetical protein